MLMRRVSRFHAIIIRHVSLQRLLLRANYGNNLTNKAAHSTVYTYLFVIGQRIYPSSIYYSRPKCGSLTAHCSVPSLERLMHTHPLSTILTSRDTNHQTTAGGPKRNIFYCCSNFSMLCRLSDGPTETTTR